MQNEMLRTHATCSYCELLHGINDHVLYVYVAAHAWKILLCFIR